jgi:hypothetical protein
MASSVAPVQVLQPQDDRPRGRHCFKCLRQLAQHALRRGARDIDGWLCAVAEPWHLRQPRRGEGFQVDRELVDTDLGAEALHGLEDRQVGLAGAVELDALGVADRCAGRCGGRRHEGSDQAGLADAGLAGHEHDLPAAGPGFCEQAAEQAQLHLAADEFRDRRRHRRDRLRGRR